MDNRPKGREKNVTGQGKDIYKRGEGLGTGPVGSQNGHAGRPGTPGSTGNAGQNQEDRRQRLLSTEIFGTDGSSTSIR